MYMLLILKNLIHPTISFYKSHIGSRDSNHNLKNRKKISFRDKKKEHLQRHARREKHH